MGNIKWWALMPAANQNLGGDGKRAQSQQWYYGPARCNPRG